MSDNVKLTASIDPAVYTEIEKEAKRKDASITETVEALIVTAVGRLAASRRYAKKNTKPAKKAPAKKAKKAPAKKAAKKDEAGPPELTKLLSTEDLTTL